MNSTNQDNDDNENSENEIEWNLIMMAKDR